jgi:hypothetical protein
MRRYDFDLITRLENETGVELKRFPKGDIEPLPANGYELDNYGYVYILTIRGEDFDRLPTLISDFAHLHTLIVRNGHLKDISGLKGLKTLTRLNLSNNRLTDIACLGELTWLNRLYLSNNLISDVSDLSRLKKLKTLDLRDNVIKTFPPAFLDLGMEIKWGRSFTEDEEGIFLVGNPMESPPVEIIKKGKKPLKAYFKELQL